MPTKGYLLDSSAWRAHLFGEPGVEEVTALLGLPDAKVAISALSLFEVHGRLAAMAKQQEWKALWNTYGLLFCPVIPADEEIVQRAIGLRQATPERLPTVDALIAATASVHGLALVHRDPHLSRIPEREVSQVALPVKG